MAQLILPQSIDAGTPVVASEVQSNFVAGRDIINGQLEGGGGAGNNFAVNGVTAREIADAVLLRGVPGGTGGGSFLQDGVVAAGDAKVTPGAGLVLNYASGVAWVTDAAALLSAQARMPVDVTGATVTIAANASGNPRIDQIILTLTGWNTGTVSVLQGTASVGATLDNRTGAAALPAGAIRLADILMPNGFAGPFIQATHIRDRRPWARGLRFVAAETAGDFNLVTGSYTAIGGPYRVEVTGNAPLIIEIYGSYVVQTAAAAQLKVKFQANALDPSTIDAGMSFEYYFGTNVISVNRAGFYARWDSGAFGAAQSVIFQPQFAESANDIVLSRLAGAPLVFAVREDMRQNSANTGA